jgi:hypothetical protein
MLLPTMVAPACAQDAPVLQGRIEHSMLLLEVRLDSHVLSDAVTAYQSADDIFLPLGELARLLTIAVRAQPGQRSATGFVLSEERGYKLDLDRATVTLAGKSEAVDLARIRIEADDIYVASALLARWLPVDFNIELSSLTLEVRPRERLPLQARLDRQDRGRNSGGRNAYVDPGYPRQHAPYRLLGMPFVDQTLGLDVRRAGPSSQFDARYTAYLTSDVAGMEAALFVTSSKQSTAPALRMTLGRHDPNAGLLGPLQARTILVGSLAVPGVANIAQSSPTGNGATLSNRPLTQPSSFDRHSLQGDLPPGWDVELYFNDALVGFQQAGPDGKYSFNDQPLAYGPNEFRLVFHGPLGQVRVERQNFLLEQSAVAPGQFYYNVTGHRDKNQQLRALAQFDWGLGRHLAASGAMVRMPVAGQEQSYANLGLHGFWQSFIISGDLVKADNGGTLAEAVLKTRMGAVAVGVSRARLDNFTSEFFPDAGDPVRIRDRIRIDGALPVRNLSVPIALELRRDQLQSGARHVDLTGRVSIYRSGTALSNTFHWQSLRETRSADGALQLSRRIAGIGLSALLQYTLQPESRLSAAALIADKNLSDGFLLNAGLTRSFQDRSTRYFAGLNKSLGRFGMGANVSYSRHAELAVGMQVFMALGREPRQSAWRTDAQPMANNGAASIRVFIDHNLNGVMDGADEPVKGAGFIVNGGNDLARTDAAGIAYLARLPAHQNTDIGIDSGTLEDPQWAPRVKGVRLVPRRGTVNLVDLPVMITGEIDGTAFLLDDGGKRGVGDLHIELVAHGKVVATTTSAADGYYIVPAVEAGTYVLRIACEQLQRLDLRASSTRPVTMAADGTFVNGLDILVLPGSQDGMCQP